MNRQFAPAKIITVTTIASVAVIVTAMILFPSPQSSETKFLQERFDQFNGPDDDPAIQTFRNCGQTAVVFLARKIQSKKPAERVKAVSALRKMGPEFTGSSAGMAALCGALNATNNFERSIAEGALGDLGPQAKDAVPALIICVSQGTDINGVWALGRIGPNAKAALPVLESKMNQPTGRERVYAAGAVWKIGGENFEAKEVVKKALKDADPSVRNDARNVLVESPEINSSS